MRATIKMATFVIVLGPVLLSLPGITNGQTALAEKVRERIIDAAQILRAACGNDLTKYCSTVTPGEGRLIFCVLAHEDKISAQCDYALYNAARNLHGALGLVEQAADVCWPDIEKYCAHMPVGGGRIGQCLIDNRTKVGHDCQIALDQMPLSK
jgi:hypothetical protein